MEHSTFFSQFMLKTFARIDCTLKSFKFLVFVYLIFAVIPVFAQTYSLEELLVDVTNSYPGILAKENELKSAESDKLVAKLKFLPTVAFQTQRTQVAYIGQPKSALPSTTISINQPIFGGGIYSGYKRSSLQEDLARVKFLVSKQDTARQLIEAYGDWYRASLKKKIYISAVNSFEQLNQKINRQFDSGIASKADVNLVTLRLEQLRTELFAIEAAENTSLNSLSRYLGRIITSRQLDEKRSSPVHIPKRDEGVVIAIDNSLAIEQSKFEAEIFAAEVTEKKSQFLPVVSFQAVRQLGNPYIPGAPSYDSYGFSVQQSLDPGFSTVASISSASSRLEAALLQVDSIKRSVSMSIIEDYSDYEVSQKKYDSFGSMKNLSQGVSDSYFRQYESNRKSILDLTTIIRESLRADVDLIDAKARILVKSWQLSILVYGLQPRDGITK